MGAGDKALGKRISAVPKFKNFEAADISRLPTIPSFNLFLPGSQKEEEEEGFCERQGFVGEDISMGLFGNPDLDITGILN